MTSSIRDAWGHTVEVAAPGIHALLAERPVQTESFLAYLRAVGRAAPRAVTRGRRLSEPVIHIPYADAQAFCEWFGQQTGRRVRLPAVAELVELAREITEQGIDREIWVHDFRLHHHLTGPFEDDFLCEWTREVTRIPRPDGRDRVLGGIFYPPWLRESGNSVHAHGHLPIDEGYSFVTFRLAQDLPK